MAGEGGDGRGWKTGWVNQNERKGEKDIKEETGESGEIKEKNMALTHIIRLTT